MITSFPASVPNRKTKMATKRDAAFSALKNVKSLNPGLHGEIVDALAAEGLCEASNGGPVLHAAKGLNRIARVQAEAKVNPVVEAALRFAGGQLRQCGSSLDDILNEAGDDVSMSRLNRVLASKSAEFRITAKTALARAGLID
jgi:hypothetical protein